MIPRRPNVPVPPPHRIKVNCPLSESRFGLRDGTGYYVVHPSAVNLTQHRVVWNANEGGSIGRTAESTFGPRAPASIGRLDLPVAVSIGKPYERVDKEAKTVVLIDKIKRNKKAVDFFPEGRELVHSSVCSASITHESMEAHRPIRSNQGTLSTWSCQM